jgi:hypothetical protein
MDELYRAPTAEVTTNDAGELALSFDPGSERIWE